MKVKCDWQHSTVHSSKPFYRRKNLAKTSYESRVIANFVPYCVAMATRERERERGKKIEKGNKKVKGKGKDKGKEKVKRREMGKGKGKRE